MINFRLLICLSFFFYSNNSYLAAQTIPQPIILEVKEDDRVATVYWNSKTNTYSNRYDADKQKGIYSYLIEWGKVADGFTEREVTPYRVFMMQPLEPNIQYQARVYALDTLGNKSMASTAVQFQHTTTRVDDMRSRLTGFFDDFNLPMGAFDETKWNQAYSGCAKIGAVSQHINDQFHGHNVIASDECDRGVASSRVRAPFDFTNRTGVIEFDLDGSKLGRNFWYLDLSPASRKRDLTGHTALEVNGVPPQSDPAYLLRFVEFSKKISIQLADEAGNLHTLDNIYQNDACGNLLEFCDGENLLPVPNVRRHWRIELSKTIVKVFINGVLMVDGSLVTSYTPSGLPYEIAQVNWLFFSYNTPKENAPLTMIHWDNFGFDAPINYSPTTIIHNYTDGILGTVTAPVGNEGSAGAIATLTTPAQSTIPIPDQILGQSNNLPISTELMFTIQGSEYSWTTNDSIKINGHAYNLPQPTSQIASLPSKDLIQTNKPHSVLLNINPEHLLTGNNQMQFYLNDARLLNIHIELTYPINEAPTYTPPQSIHANYMQKLMHFHHHTAIGPGIVFTKIDGVELYQSEFQQTNDETGAVTKIVKQSPVAGTINLDLEGNSAAQLAATGHAAGIAYYEIWIDKQVIQTIRVDKQEAIAAFEHKNITLNTANFTNGTHELFLQAYDENGKVSVFDLFLANVQHGEYVPIEITIQNTTPNNCTTILADMDLGGGNPNTIPTNTYQVSNSIVSNGTVATGTRVIFDAGNQITLKEGFNVENGANFTAKIGGCISLIASSSIMERKKAVNPLANQIKMYPNPAIGQVQIDIQLTATAAIKVQVFDFTGKLWMDFSPKYGQFEQYSLNVSNWAAGTYFVKVTVNEAVEVKKMVVGI